MQGLRIRITGVVQGVGFRPFVYNLAVSKKITGFCLNDSEGVTIEAYGEGLDGFVTSLKDNAPPLSRITGIRTEPCATDDEVKAFTIKGSISFAGAFGLISPDVAVCEDCLAELFDPDDRRHLYPFINCTNCGPRYTIIIDMPYDRPNTTMKSFKMCQACEAEYHDPSNRRFHAQPNACGICGPRAWLVDKTGTVVSGNNKDAVTEAVRLLKEGGILAIKGIGGFHLSCDATNDRAVSRLRKTKRSSVARGTESNKPFAIMSPDAQTVDGYAWISESERHLLEDLMRPIVLLRKKEGGQISRHVAPGSADFGVMLPYAPLHHMFFHGSGFSALVMTSGNRADEPIVTSNKDSIERLSSMADYFLIHDREIHMRADDSIARMNGPKASLSRRARGFVPTAIDLGAEMEDILAVGPELKNTFCLTKGRFAILSTHIGDMENAGAMGFFRETLENLRSAFKSNPSIVARDMHPGYATTGLASDYSRNHGIPPERVIDVQHHHAHIASVMAEHGLREKVLGVAFDGTGYGTDGTIWGGEFLVCARSSFERFGHLVPVGLPGGDAAVKEPWRMALSYLHLAYGASAPEIIKKRLPYLDTPEAKVVLKMLEGSLNTPLTSSAGRLFDAVSALTGVREMITYEAEAAINLEAISGRFIASDTLRAGGASAYPFIISDEDIRQIDPSPMIRAIVEDISRGISAPEIGARFHMTLARMITETLVRMREETGINLAALSGGTFQNRLLLRLAMDSLANEGFTVYINEQVPSNDGGVSLGQATVAWEMVKGGR